MNLPIQEEREESSSDTGPAGSQSVSKKTHSRQGSKELKEIKEQQNEEDESSSQNSSEKRINQNQV